MCGRFTITVDRVELLQKKFQAELAPNFEGYQPRYNAAPGQFVPVIITKEGGIRYLMNALWGFVAPWGEKGDGNTISQANIRNDTIVKNKFFGERLKNNRCIFIVDGFYEWKKPPGYEYLSRGERLPKGVRKIPYRIVMKDQQPFPLAGLWRSIKTEKQAIVTVGIITTEPNRLVKPIHDRMPVILSDDDLPMWLDTSYMEIEPLQHLLRPYPEKSLEAYIVRDVVNNSRIDSPVCIEPAI